MIYIVKRNSMAFGIENEETCLGAFTSWDRTIKAIREDLKANNESCHAVDVNVRDPFLIEDNPDYGVSPIEVEYHIEYPLDHTNKYYSVTAMLLDGE